MTVFLFSSNFNVNVQGQHVTRTGQQISVRVHLTKMFGPGSILTAVAGILLLIVLMCASSDTTARSTNRVIL